MAKPKARFGKGRKTCIFCDGTPISEEHVWPLWARSILPLGKTHYRNLFTADKAKGEVRADKLRSRQGSAATIRIERVCIACNSGWMGTYEEEVRGPLEKMILGKSMKLTVADQKLLAEYFTYKMMVVDWEDGHPIISEKHRRLFYEKRTIPPNTLIFLFNSDEPWNLKLTGTSLGLWREGGEPKGPSFRNAKSFSVSMGRLFVNAVMAPDAEVDLGLTFQPGISIRVNPPFKTDVHWPPFIRIDAVAAGQIAESLFKIDESPGFKSES